MSIVIDPGDGTATDTLQSTDAPLSQALRRGLDGGGLPLESPEESQASQADAPVSLVGPDFFPVGQAEIPQSAEPPQEMLDAAFSGNDWNIQQSEHDAALARHYRESQEQIDQAALRGEQYFQEDDLSFAPDAATGAMLGTNDMFLRTYTGGAPVPVSGAQRRLAILQTSIARFGEPLDTDEALFSRLQSDARYHADAGVLAQTLALNARQSALLQQVEPQRAAGFTWETFRRQALKSPGYRDGDDSFLYDAWQDIHRQSRKEFQSVAPAIGQVWQAIREGGAGTPSEIGKAFLSDLFYGDGEIFEDTRHQLARKDAGALAGRLYYELSPSQRATFMDGLGVLARTFPKEEQARFFSNLAKEGGRAVDDLVRNIASVPASGDDIIGFGDFGIGTDTTEKLRREWKAKRPEMLAARNFASDVRRIEREEYAPLKSAWGDGAPGMVESGLYAIPGVAASVGLASIPYAGELALYSSMEGSAYDGLRDQLRRSGLDDERASALADEWSGVVAAPMAALGRLQAGAVLRRTPYLERLLPKIGTLFESSVARFTARTALSTAEQTGMQLVQEQIPYALQDFQSRLSPLIPGVEWRNGRDGPLDGLWTRAGSAAIAGLPLALFIGLHGLHRDASSRGIAATPDIERRALGITPEASAAINAAKGRGQTALNTPVSEALATRNPESIHARAALEELKARDEERRRLGDPAKAGYPAFVHSADGIEIRNAATGEVVGTARNAEAALKIAQTHFEAVRELDADRIAHLASMLEANQLTTSRSGSLEETTVEYSPFERLTAELEAANHNEARVREQMLAQELLGGGDGSMTELVTGKSVTTFKGRLRSTLNKLFGGSTVLEVFHEESHGLFRDALARGRLTRQDAIDAIRALQKPLEGRFTRDGQPLQLIPAEGHVSWIQLDEAVSKVMESEILRHRRGGTKRIVGMPESGGREIPSAIITRNLTAAARTAPEATRKFSAFAHAVRKYFGAAFQRALAIDKGIRDGTIDSGRHREFIDRLLGLDGEGAGKESGGFSLDEVGDGEAYSLGPDPGGGGSRPKKKSDVSPEVYKMSLKRRLELHQGPEYDWQRANAGKYIYELVGGGVKFDADGVEGTFIQEAKFVKLYQRSPFIYGSNVFEPVRAKIVAETEDAFWRMSLIIGDSSNPLEGVDIIVNDVNAAPFFIDMLKKFDIPGRIIIR